MCIKNTLQSSTDCYRLHSLLTSRIGSGGWSTEGVTTVRVTQEGNNTTVQCNSTHLTSFAVLSILNFPFIPPSQSIPPPKGCNGSISFLVDVTGYQAVVSTCIFNNVLLMKKALTLESLYVCLY